MKGGARKTRKMKSKRKPTETVSLDKTSPQATAKSDDVPSNHSANVSKSLEDSLQTTPTKDKGINTETQQACLTSTPVHCPTSGRLSDFSTSASVKQVEVLTQLETSVDSQSKPKTPSRRGRRPALQPRQVRRRATKEKTQTSSTDSGPPAKRQRGRPRKVKTVDTTTQTLARHRPRFELQKPDASEQNDKSWLSSDLSIELSHHEELSASLQLEEDEQSDEEEELPSFLMQMDKKPPCITEGAFVWVKFRNYPFWPALVKSVNRKQRKASILFIDDPMIHKKKGFTVALKTVKPFDCEEAKDLMCKAKEEYDAAIEWSLELVADYRIRIACGSFTGSFIEYFAHAMSYPVRKNYPQAASERLTIASDSMTEALCCDLKENSFGEQEEEVSRTPKRLLPDRSHAAHNRANEKLVHFIVKQRMVDDHLLAVIHGQQQSRWLRLFQSANRRRVVNIYLEDDQQLDQVYWYLNDLYAKAVASGPGLTKVKSMELVPFVLDVLLPEAIIYAIAGVDNVSVKKAEEKYLKGRSISKRERQEFDLMIEEQIRKKSLPQKTALIP